MPVRGREGQAMNTIDTLDELEALYGAPRESSLSKVQSELTPCYQSWIEASKFLVLVTVGKDGTDGSPRGDDGPVVRIADRKTILLPDWWGNNRLDSLRNIVTDGRVSLMFMVPGSTIVVRVNGTAVVSADNALTFSFEKNGKVPKSVTVVTVGEVYFQCAKALMRSALWSEGDRSAGLPTMGDFKREITEGFDARAFDEGFPDYARERMW